MERRGYRQVETDPEGRIQLVRPVGELLDVCGRGHGPRRGCFAVQSFNDGRWR